MLRCVHRSLVLILAVLGGLLAAVAGARAAHLEHAPGRVVFSVNGGVMASGVDGGTATAAVALPDGGAVLIGNARAGFYAAQLNANGGLDPSFGSGGVAHIMANLPTYSEVQQIVRQADGKLVIAVYGRPDNRFAAPGLMLVRLNPDGRLDQSFGTAGVDKLAIHEECVECAPLAPARDGDLIVTGKGVPPAVTPSASVARAAQWVVARLTSTGALDSSFGRAGIVAITTLPGTAGVGHDAIALTNGDVVTLGSGVLASGSGSLLTRLLPSGAADPTFNHGTPAILPGEHGSAIVAYPNGSIVAALDGALARYTATGILDPTFGSNGVAQIGSTDPYRLLPGAGSGPIVVIQRQAAPLKQRVKRITVDGALDPTLGGSNGVLIQTPFGGGAATPPVADSSRPVPSLAQNSFRQGFVLPRPDGSNLVVGGVTVSQLTGVGIQGNSIFDFAVAALTSSFTPDTSFGGPATAPNVRLRVPPQRTATALSRHAIRITLNASAPGLASVTINAHGRLVAQSVLPVFTAHPATVMVKLTRDGAKWLHHHPHTSLRATAQARDLLTNIATATAHGSLR